MFFCKEEGIEWANSGRARALMSGMTAVLHVRVVPLAPSICRALQKKKEGNTTIVGVATILSSAAVAIVGRLTKLRPITITYTLYLYLLRILRLVFVRYNP